MDTDRQNRKIRSLVTLFLSVILSLLAFVVVQTPNIKAAETCEIYPGYTMTCPQGYFCGTVSGQKRCLPPSYITPTVAAVPTSAPNPTAAPVPTSSSTTTTIGATGTYTDWNWPAPPSGGYTN